MVEEVKNEVWKDIVGWEGLYQVSNLGRIKSLDRLIMRKKKTGVFPVKYKGQLMSGTITNRGYCVVTLSQSSVTKTELVHRLVAEQFLENKNQLPCVNHIDGVKTNNDVRNLEWCTYKENTLHAIEIGKFECFSRSKNHASILSDDQVYVIKILLKSGCVQNRIAEHFGIRHQIVSDIKTGKTWKSLELDNSLVEL